MKDKLEQTFLYMQIVFHTFSWENLVNHNSMLVKIYLAKSLGSRALTLTYRRESKAIKPDHEVYKLSL